MLASALFFQAEGSRLWAIIVSCVIGKPIDIIIKLSFDWLHRPVLATMHDAANSRRSDKVTTSSEAENTPADASLPVEEVSLAEPPLRRAHLQNETEYVGKDDAYSSKRAAELNNLDNLALSKLCATQGMDSDVVLGVLASQDPRQALIDWLCSFDMVPDGRRRPCTRAILPNTLTLLCGWTIALFIARTVRTFSPRVTGEWALVVINSLCIRFMLYDTVQIVAFSGLAIALGNCFGKSSRAARAAHRLVACCSGSTRLKFKTVDVAEQILYAAAVFQAHLLRSHARLCSQSAAAALQARHRAELEGVTSTSIAAELRQKQHLQKQYYKQLAKRVDEEVTQVIEGQINQFMLIEAPASAAEEQSNTAAAVALMKQYNADVQEIGKSMQANKQRAHERLLRRRQGITSDESALNSHTGKPTRNRLKSSRHLKRQSKQIAAHRIHAMQQMAPKIAALQSVFDRHRKNVDAVVSSGNLHELESCNNHAEVTAAKRRFQARVKLLIAVVSQIEEPSQPRIPQPDHICYYCREKGHWKDTCPKLIQTSVVQRANPDGVRNEGMHGERSQQPSHVDASNLRLDDSSSDLLLPGVVRPKIHE
eukprot:COSAG01_NODE_5738_length_4066_cov_8.679859_3_plen_595_part_00